MNASPKSLLDRLVGTTVTIVLIAFGLSWAWQLVRPLVPIFVLVAIVIVVLRVVRARRDDW